MKRKIPFFWTLCLSIIFLGSFFMWQVQGKTAHALAQLTFELEKGKEVMALSVDALKLNARLHERNKRSLEMTRRTILGMKVTSLLTEETIAMQKQGIALLQETVDLARQTKKELARTQAYSKKLFDLGKKTEKAAQPLEEFALLSFQLAQKGYEIAASSLKIVQGEEK